MGQDLSQTLNLRERFRFLQSRASGVPLAPILGTSGFLVSRWKALWTHWGLVGPEPVGFVGVDAVETLRLQDASVIYLKQNRRVLYSTGARDVMGL